MAQDGTDDEQYAKDLELLIQAMSIMRDWISQTFKNTFLNSSFLSGNSSENEIQVSTPKISLSRGLYYFFTKVQNLIFSLLDMEF